MVDFEDFNHLEYFRIIELRDRCDPKYCYMCKNWKMHIPEKYRCPQPDLCGAEYKLMNELLQYRKKREEKRKQEIKQWLNEEVLKKNEIQ